MPGEGGPSVHPDHGNSANNGANDMTIYQAIETRYLGPTNTKGGRIKATAWAGSVTIPYDHALNTDENHYRAAMALAAKCAAHAEQFGGKSIWSEGQWTQGGNAKGTGYVFTVTAPQRA